MTTKRFALLGDPVAHSKSPLMHAAAYRALGLACTYEAIRVMPPELGSLVRALRDGAYDGLNVTVPHKRRILEHVDRADPSAATVGAANTLVRGEDGAVVAHNTDVPALVAELARLAPERTAEEWRRSRAIVLGAGGAAASAIAALARLEVSEVVVCARSLPNAPASCPPGGRETGRAPVLLAREPTTTLTYATLGARSLLAGAVRALPVLTVVQATSAGMTGADPGERIAEAIPWSDLPSHAIALDVVYSPPLTPFLRAAAARGLRSANGLGMLARQGALAVTLWLGVPPPYEAMLASLAPTP
jgi:shikimate dehydrogenase